MHEKSGPSSRDVTERWQRNQLIAEKYWYFADASGIKVVYFPGGAALEVDSCNADFLQLKNGRVFRMPKDVRCPTS